MHFARLLRRAGLSVGPAESIAATQALTLVDVGERQEMRAALRAVMVHRHEDLDLFDHAFDLFWRLPEHAVAGPQGKLIPSAAPPPGARRLAEALSSPSDSSQPNADPEESFDAAETASARELLQKMDFEAMSAAQIARAKAEIKTLRLPLDERRTRRWRPRSRYLWSITVRC